MQLRFAEVDGTIVFFNEAEAVCDLEAPEPETLEPAPERRRKATGKKAQDMSGLPTNRIGHYMTEEELTAEFGENGWKQLPDAITRRYRFIPAKVEVDEHHVELYSAKSPVCLCLVIVFSCSHKQPKENHQFHKPGHKPFPQSEDELHQPLPI